MRTGTAALPSLGAAVVVAAEFVVIGLMPAMAAELRLAPSRIGRLVTLASAWSRSRGRDDHRTPRPNLYLPLYSRDTNPIEMGSPSSKALLRQAPARTIDALAIALETFDRFLPIECANYFHAAGYQRHREIALSH